MRKCKFCGQEVNEDDKFCPFCGAKIDEQTTQIISDTQSEQKAEEVLNNQQTDITGQKTDSTQIDSTLTDTQNTNTSSTSVIKPKFSGNAIAGFVVSLIGFIAFAIICGVVSITLSAIALKETKQNVKRGRGLAIAGLVLGIIDVIAFFAML